MRYALTGASGMLGHAIDEEMRAAGHERAHPPGQEIPPWTSPSTGEVEPDYRSAQYLEWLEGERLDLFVHSGAIVGTTRCEAHAEDVWSCNASGPHALARVLAERRILTAFMATASEMAPDAHGLEAPISMVRTPVNPRTRYGMTKLAGRLLTREAFRAAGAEDLLLEVYPSFGFGGMRDGDSCVADSLKCAAGVYDRRPYITLDPARCKEVTPHAWIARLVRRAAEDGWFGRIPAAAGHWVRYGDLIDVIRRVTGVRIEPEWHPELDYLGDFVHDVEEVAAVREGLGLEEVNLEDALRVEWEGILAAHRDGGGVRAVHEWRFSEKLAEGRNAAR